MKTSKDTLLHMPEMMTVTKDMIISKCQEFSPPHIVERLLDSAGYTENLYGKKVLENSFGQGNVLVGVVSRYIKQCKKEGFSKEQIKEGLAEDLYGYEIDNSHYVTCISKLDEITTRAGLGKVDWRNLHLADYLSADINCKFDYVVGNPPYIDYRAISEELRAHLKDHFLSCKDGKFDFCYPFIEKSLSELNAHGRLALLIPVNVYKNRSARILRQIMKEGLCTITVFPSQKLFKPSVLTSSSIFVFEQGHRDSSFTYIDDTSGETLHMALDDLNDDKWVFLENAHSQKEKCQTFGDLFSVSMVVATLYNKAFLVSPQEVKAENLEEKLIRPAISPHAIRQEREEFIIFPYEYDATGQLIRIPEEDFSTLYPNISNHLFRHKQNLSTRKSDKSTQWFEYGRTQALRKCNQPKLIISTIISGQVKVHKLDTESIPYAGIMITEKAENHSLEEAKKLLESEAFRNYAHKVGVTVNNGSIRLSSKDVASFPLPR